MVSRGIVADQPNTSYTNATEESIVCSPGTKSSAQSLMQCMRNLIRGWPLNHEMAKLNWYDGVLMDFPQKWLPQISA